jgi:hypothetical protein
VKCLLALLCFAGCTGSLDEPSLVKDLRILAIQAEPPEAVQTAALPDIALRALVADPRDPERTIAWSWQSCGLTDDLRCASADYADDLASEEGPLADIAATLVLDAPLLSAAQELDTYLGFGGVTVVAELALGAGTDEELHAIKQVPVWLALPPGTDPNANPSPPALRHGRLGESRDDVLANWPESETFVDWPEDEVLEVPAGTAVSVEPMNPAEDVEHYAVYRFDLGIEELDESLMYDFLASDGEWTRNRSGGASEIVATETTLASIWTAPAEVPAEDVAMWFVVRDGRGGTSWIERRVRVVP